VDMTVLPRVACMHAFTAGSVGASSSWGAKLGRRGVDQPQLAMLDDFVGGVLPPVIAQDRS
jgi:hypothetical protein